MNTARIICGDAREVLATLPAESVRCVVTSPPYWGLRDYGVAASIWGGKSDCSHRWGKEVRLHKGGSHGDGVMLKGSRSVIEAQAAVKKIRAGAFCCRCGAWRGCLGLEPTFELYVEHMVEIFDQVRRVLQPDGTAWLNLGDSYATGGGAVGRASGGGDQGERFLRSGMIATQPNRMPQPGLKPKDLVGIPWRVAFALQAAGWWLRSDVIWSKPNPMPESVRDRPTKSHEYLFLLSKSERYRYDSDAVREPHKAESLARYQYGLNVSLPADGLVSGGAANPRALGHCEKMADNVNPLGHNKRSVWTICTQPFEGAHFAVMPEALAEPCILAGAECGDLVLDPFAGAGTVGVVALKHGRNFIGIELNPTYAQMARDRIHNDAPLLNRAEVGT